MTSLFLSLFLSLSWANESCNELLQNVHTELEAARAENRSKLIKGIISQTQYERMHDQLEAKMEQLMIQGTKIDYAIKTQNERRKAGNTNQQANEEFSMQLVPELTLEVDGFTINNMDYNPSTGHSLFNLKSEDEISGLYISKGKGVESELIKLPLASSEVKPRSSDRPIFWPGSSLSALVISNGQSYLYQNLDKTNYTIKSMSDLDDLFLNGWGFTQNEQLFFSNRIATDSLKLQDSKSFNVYAEIALNGKGIYDSVTVSPDENLMVMRNKKKNSINLLNLNSKSLSELAFNRRGFANLLGVSFSADSMTINAVFVKLGKPIFCQFDVNKLLESVFDSSKLSSLIEESKRNLIKLSEFYEFVRYKFSPNGRFLLIEQQNKEFDQEFIVYDLQYMIEIARNGMLDKNMFTRYNFSRDSQGLFFYRKNKANIYRFLKEHSEGPIQ